MEQTFNITPLNETAVLVQFGNCIDEAVNKKAIALWQLLTAQPFSGFIEAVPAYASVAVFYDLVQTKKAYPFFATAFDAVKNYINSLNPEHPLPKPASKKIFIPVLYNGEDLALIAAEKKLTPQEVIQLHTAQTYRVYMIGFLPGFAYMGTVAENIAMPRKTTPRMQVPAGSVGIAGKQTGIYPIASPGGWQLLGQTPIKIFNSKKNKPCLLQAGDDVQFVSIGKQEFEKLNEY